MAHSGDGSKQLTLRRERDAHARSVSRVVCNSSRNQVGTCETYGLRTQYFSIIETTVIEQHQAESREIAGGRDDTATAVEKCRLFEPGARLGGVSYGETCRCDIVVGRESRDLVSWNAECRGRHSQ